MVVAPRVRLALLTAVLCALAGVAGVLLARAGDDAAGLDGGGRFAGAVRPHVPPQDFTLRDQDGERVSLRDYRGEVVLLTFLYSHCRDTCPQQAHTIRGALDRLGRDVPAFAVSVDPRGDTPNSARRFLAREGVTGRLRFLLGSDAELRPIWKAYGIAPQTDRFDHSAYVLLIDRRGRQRVAFPFGVVTPEGLAHDLRELLAERG